MFQNFATKITVYREKLLVESCVPRGFRAANRIPWNRPKKKSREILSEWWIPENEKSYKTIFPEIFPDKTDDLRLDGFEGRIDENEQVTEFRLI